MGKISISIQKKDLWLLSAIFVFLVGVGFVLAVDNPAVMGHTLGQIALPSCSDGQVLQKTSTGWGCGSIGPAAVWKHSGVEVYSGTPAASNTWYNLSLVSVVGSKRAFVMLKIVGDASNIYFRAKGDVDSAKDWITTYSSGDGAVNIEDSSGDFGSVGTVSLETNDAGEIQFYVDSSRNPTKIYVLGYISS